MLKRTLSFLLCLIMVLGFAAPSVKATGTDDGSASNFLDGIYIPEGSDGTVIVNGEDVTEEVKKNTFDDIPSQGEMTTPTTSPSIPAVVDLCQCVDLATAEDHSGVCKVKAHYYDLCNASEEELYAQWASFTPVEQSFIREYLRETFPLKLVAIEQMLSVPNSSASELLADGTTVSVEGIPEYSSLTVADAADDVKNIVDAYVAENQAASTELFSYDVSVQDAEGSDWQPDTSVKMELELPGQKLHKYSKVYVVHVDDNGVATTIEAEVTEDGKIAFETPGFSTFVGFTVDFEFNGIQMSIPGMSGIKLSALLDSLKMPVYAEDVVDVVYTDYTQLKIEQLEGDWLLTSLKAFTTEEILTLFMADGAVYEIKVTDAIVGQRADCHFAYNGYTGNICYIDVSYYSTGDHNGVVTIMVSDDTGYGVTTYDNASSYYANSNWWLMRVVFDGNGVEDNISNGATEVCIEKNGTGDAFKVPVVNWYITGGATVNVYLEGFDSNDTISFESWVDGSPLITVDNGTLYFNVDSSVLPKDTSTTSGYIRNFHVTACPYKEIILDGYDNVVDNEDAIIFADDSAKAVYVNDVKFIKSDRRAVHIRADQMSEFRMDNCIFDSTIKSANGGGGAIYVAEKTSGGAWVNVDKFTLRYCEFDQQKVASTEKTSDGKPKVVRGGAVLIWGNLDNTNFYHCKFYKTNATAQGGAVSIGDQSNTFNQGDITFEGCEFDGTTNDNSLAGAVLICQLANELAFKDCIFKNITGAGHGGVIHIGGTDDVGITYASFTMTGCSFNNCKTTGGRGGVLRLYSTTANPVTITDCTFTTCSAYSLGGALSFQGTIGTLTISGTAANKSSFSDCKSTNEKGGAISLDATITKCEIKNTSFSTCKSQTRNGGAIYHGGITGDFDVTNCSFTSCEALVYGGAIALYGRTTTTDITGGSFTGCKAGGTQPMYKEDKVTPIFDKKGNHMYNGTGGGAAICIVQNHGTINIGGTSTTKQTFSNCESLNNGGAISFEGACEVQTCNIQYVSIDGCKARDSGSAILLGDVTVVNMSIKDSEIKNCSYVSGYTGADAIKNSLYDEYYTEGMDYDSIIFRTNDSHGTIRTIGSVKAQLVVESVTFTNNTSLTGGGGIYWNANRLAGYASDKDGTYTFKNSLAIKNCTFEDNYAFRDGGAIYVEASLTVEGGTFKNNSAQRGGAIAQQIYNNSGRPIQSGETNNLIITGYTSGSTTTKAVFDGNYARNHGGAISVLCNATGSITTTESAPAMSYPITCQITGAEIKNNRAAENGGGVYFYQMSYPTDYADPGSMTETETALDNKEVEGYVKSLILDGSSVFGNYSGCGKDKLTTPESANGYGHGGGIYLNAKKNTTLQVLGCNVYSNTAHYGNGGGIYMTGQDGVCQMKANSAGTVTVIGGAADKANKATSSAPGTAEGQNTGNGGGIGIFIKGRIEMQGGTVSYNTAETAGGGIAVNGSTMEFSNGTVTNNTAKYGGGVSLTNSGDPSTIADESLENPPALTPAWGMVFTNGTVTNNVADIGGGICVSNSSTMKLDGGKVNTNYAATKSGSSYSYITGQHGGGIAVVAGSKMNIYGGEITSNRASNGGGVAVQGGSALQMLPKSGSTAAGTVFNNTAVRYDKKNGYGGGIYLKDADSASVQNVFYIKGGTVSSNSAYDGAGLMVGTYCKATFSGGSISSNKATYLGGGIYASGATLDISGGDINSNTGTYSGGGIYACSASTITFSNGSIYSNHCGSTSGWGGGVYLTGSNTTMEITGGSIYSNYVSGDGCMGGGINAEYSAKVTISGGEMYSNQSMKGNGGAIFAKKSATIIVKGGTIRDNTAGAGGGGIALDENATAQVTTYTPAGSTQTVIGKIQGNTAANGGGVYVIGGAELQVTNGHIVNNKAIGKPTDTSLQTAYHKESELKGVGGGIYVANGTGGGDRSIFKLEGTQIAIYGNTADFAADDVFANANYTQLTIPTVKNMDLDGFDFPAEGWVEDYCTADEYYVDNGLNMIQFHINQNKDNGIAVPDELYDEDVNRYRSTPAMYRNYLLIEPEYVTGKNANGTSVSGNYVNKADAYVAMTLGVPGAVDDTIVIDYLTTVNINLWQNDMFLDQDDFRKRSDSPIGIGSAIGWTFPSNTISNSGIYYTSGADNAKPAGTYPKDYSSMGKPYGSAYNGQNGVLTYVPTKISFTDADEFFYTVLHNGYWYYAKVTVMPATTLYFEDTNELVKYHKNAEYAETLAEWVVEGASMSYVQDEDRPGGSLMAALDKNNVYGYDSSYASTQTFSNGGAHKVTVSGDHVIVDDNGDGVCDTCNCVLSHDCVDRNPKDGCCDKCFNEMGRHYSVARATFTFTGTGFDIISLCNSKTTSVMVNVYRGDGKDLVFEDNPNTPAYDVSTPLATYYVDTWYQTGTLYQVPVIKVDMTKVQQSEWDPTIPQYDENGNLIGHGDYRFWYEDYGYGTYTVEIFVSTSWFNVDATDFYLDAIRIYNPAGLGEFNGAVSNKVIEDAYLADNEGWPVYQELRDMFLTEKDYETLKDMTDEEIEKAIEEGKLPTMGNILFIDRNTAPRITDYMNFGPNNEVYLNPGQAIAFTMDLNNCTNVASIQVGLRCLTGKGRVTINGQDGSLLVATNLGTTDMYYKISWRDISGQVITIANSGKKPIAISNIKITHTSAPEYAQSPVMFKVNRRTAEIALEILSAEQLVESPVVTPKRPALSFNGMVCYNVFFSAENLGDLTADDLGLAVFSTEDTEGTIETAREVIYGATEIDGLYMTATGGVHAKYLGDKQYFRAFARKSDGTYVYSKMVSYSALDYAKNALAKSSDVKLKQLVVAMLNYGAEAQKFFGYKTDDLMNASLTADDQALLAGYDATSLNAVGKVDASKVGVFVSNRGFTDRKPAISFKGAFEINYFLTPAYTVDGDMKLYFWNEDTYNSVTELTAENADKVEVMTLENGIYAACSDEIAAKYLDKTVYVAAVYESDGVTYCSGVMPYSIAAYCQKPPAGVQALATAAAIYGCTAKEYFGV